MGFWKRLVGGLIDGIVYMVLAVIFFPNTPQWAIYGIGILVINISMTRQEILDAIKGER